MDLTFRGTDAGRPEEHPAADRPLAAAPLPVGRAHAPTTGWTVAVVATLALGVVVRFATWSHLWLDEALTVNIARLPLRALPEALRMDGAPPVYYVLLHAWTAVFGTSTFAVRALPGLFAVASIPLTFLVARRVGGPQVAWAATLLVASGPFGARYGTEARMYSLVIDLVLVGALAVLALLRGGGEGGRTAVAVLAVVTGIALLTHYWSFYLLPVVAGALWVVSRRSEEPTARRGARVALVGLAGGCVLFLPWAPTFLYQLAHTGTPWGKPGNLRSMFDTVTHFAGGYWDPGIALGLLYFALVVLAVFGWAVDGRRVLLDMRPHSPGAGLAAVTFGTLAVAIVAGRVGGSAFAVRYAAVLYPLFIVLVALGTEVFADRRVHHGVLVVAVVLGFWANVPNVVGDRTSAGRVAAALNATAQPGDVVAYCPDQLGPAVSRELRGGGSGLVQLTFPRSGSPDRVDWVDYAKVNKAARTADFAQMLLDRAGPTHDVWMVWAPGYRTLGTRCQNIIERLGVARPANQRLVKVSTRYFERPGLVRFRAGPASPASPAGPAVPAGPAG